MLVTNVTEPESIDTLMPFIIDAYIGPTVGP